MNGYDVVMILWGAVFVVAWIGFIVTMDRIFRRETETQDETASAWEATEHLPLKPAA